MRRFILVLMIALLPLRGWVGDAMALEMASLPLSQPESALQADTGSAHEPASAADMDAANAMHADCPGHAASHDGVPQTATHCASCAVYHAVALTPSFTHLAPASPSSTRPPSAAPRFASAERALSIKPPIS